MNTHSSYARNLLATVSMTFLLLVITSCSTEKPSPPIDLVDEFTNHQIKIRLSPVLNSFKNQDSVLFELKSESSNVITFPFDYNLRIFELNNNVWQEIGEIPTERYPQDDIVFSPNITRPPVEAIFVVPNIRDFSKSHQLRVYVFGEMATDNGIEQVAAYVDFELQP